MKEGSGKAQLATQCLKKQPQELVLDQVMNKKAQVQRNALVCFREISPKTEEGGEGIIPVKKPQG